MDEMWSWVFSKDDDSLIVSAQHEDSVANTYNSLDMPKSTISYMYLSNRPKSREH